jgi:hypothetical protein
MRKHRFSRRSELLLRSETPLSQSCGPFHCFYRLLTRKANPNHALGDVTAFQLLLQATNLIRSPVWNLSSSRLLMPYSLKSLTCGTQQGLTLGVRCLAYFAFPHPFYLYVSFASQLLVWKVSFSSTLNLHFIILQASASDLSFVPSTL